MPYFTSCVAVQYCGHMLMHVRAERHSVRVCLLTIALKVSWTSEARIYVNSSRRPSSGRLVCSPAVGASYCWAVRNDRRVYPSIPKGVTIP